LLTVTYRGYSPNQKIENYFSFSPTPRHLAIIQSYEDFEQQLVRILRKYSALADPEAIYEIPQKQRENQKRKEALSKYLLEECLWPDKEWLVDLDTKDQSWPKLLPYLRAIEAMILHREAKEDQKPLGDQFLKEIHHLVFDKATDIKFILEGKKDISSISLAEERDPFLDYSNYPYFTSRYLETLKRSQESKDHQKNRKEESYDR
jgi:hypothetical protein